MLRQDSNASTVLAWVRPDLDKHLNQIRTQIEHIANSAHVGNGINDTTEHLTQLKYTFEALVFQGATIVIEEMITVCDELNRFNIRDRGKAFSALMDAIVVLPSYLDRLQAGHHDLPILLLPVINELRAAYKANIVSEATLFAPSLNIPLPELEYTADNPRPTFDEPLPAFIQRTCKQWEGGLLQWLQKQNNLELLSPLRSICELLYARLHRTDLRRMWWIAATVIDGVKDGVTDNDVELRRLLARLHLTIKTVLEGGEDNAKIQSIDAVSQALLFHIAQAKKGNAAVDDLRNRFALEELVPDRDVLIRARGAVTGRNRELYTSLGSAVHDELAMIKDALDLELRTGKVEIDRRNESHEALLRLQDTLKMMGLADSARSVEKLMPEFEASKAPDEGPGKPSRESLLMGLASKLIQVESVLEEQIVTLGEPLIEDQQESFIDLPRHEQRRIQAHLLDEAVMSLHQVQEAVRRHFSGDQSADYISPMEHIAGAIELMGEAETAKLATQLRNALGNLLQHAWSEAAMDKEQLETVTDAVAAFELYLAGCRDHQSNRGRFLTILKERLSRLPVGEMEARATPVPAPATDQQTAKQDSTPGSNKQAIIDPELLEVFLEEFEGVTVTLREKVSQWVNHHEDTSAITEIRRGFHTLKGSGRMVGAYEIGDFAWGIEELLNTMLEGDIKCIDDVATLVRLAETALPEMKNRLLKQPSDLDAIAIAALVQQAGALTAGDAPDWASLHEALPDFLTTLLPGSGKTAIEESPATEKPPAELTIKALVCKELADNLAILTGFMDRISKDRTYCASDAETRAIHTIAGTTALHPLGNEPGVAKALETLLETQSRAGMAFDDTAVWAIATSLSYLESVLAVHEGDPEAQLASDEAQQIEQLEALTVKFTTREAPAEQATAEVTEETTPTPDEVQTTAPEDTEDTAKEPDTGEPSAEPVDTEILNIFLEEATDILERCDSLLNTWRDDLPDLSIVQNLQREIHTFKGGARMAGINAMGDLSHSMETLLERIAGQLLQPSLSAIAALEKGCDRLNTWVEQASQGVMPTADKALLLFEQQVEALNAVPVHRAAVEPKPVKIDTAPEELLEIPDVLAPANEPEASEVSGEESASSQQIRVNSDLLDSLVNSAGEISIFRSRLEQQVGNIRDNLKEFDETVSRLREQFRKLEIETETQINSRYQHDLPDESDEFDPLEMDRFSSMQQLSRSMSESVADLLNLQELLDDAARKSEALLVQQSRVSNELQEGLMQTRMVHFGTIAPRLRRIIRTASSETGKKARLQLRMTDGGDQLDRNVLERITAPLEHLLRNSIAHGIEKPGQRRKLKKPEEGQLSITVAAEATEFVVRVEDDGAGMDLKAIQERAVKMGLLDAKAKPRPQQLMQFILHSGFSTSKKVTALAGRGVGMDVVNSEIKQIGGSVEIDTVEGKGTRFTIRIPFTLAVMQAIDVVAGEHRYLIPVASVAGVARVLPADYQLLLEQEVPTYEFAGEKYAILELEPLLGEPVTPVGNDTISILIIRSGEHRAAFRVPQLKGHREIVIKPVGPQISSVPGILGGTITSQGQVVIIIDAGPLIRQALLTGVRPAPLLEKADNQPQRTLAMVVDDSITMRKVATRVLESHNFEVVTAKDGVDATEQMQDRVPDLILLDIEMPRMDGYQVAEYVRADTRLRHIPIVMITSRAGKKHRERGEQAGANAYLSKPYKESELIMEVTKLLSKKAE